MKACLSGWGLVCRLFTVNATPRKVLKVTLDEEIKMGSRSYLKNLKLSERGFTYVRFKICPTALR